jgi:hypothetical protein
MDTEDCIGVSPKIRILTPKNACIRKVWTFIYRFMHNLLGLFAKCCINLEKQKHPFERISTVLPKYFIFCWPIYQSHLLLTTSLKLREYTEYFSRFKLHFHSTSFQSFLVLILIEYTKTTTQPRLYVCLRFFLGFLYLWFGE